MNIKILVIEKEQTGKRLDVFLADSWPEMTRSYYQNLIKDNRVTSSGKILKSNHIVKSPEEIRVEIPPAQIIDLIPEDIKIDIIYEDEEIAVVNKPQGMVVHPAAGHPTGTLVNALLFHCDHLSGINGQIRPGIVHRIDKDTSGLLVIAKNDKAHQSLSKQIQAKTATRVYWALVEGALKQDHGTVNQPIGRHPHDRKKMAVINTGRLAVTHFRVLEQYQDCSLIEAKLETGRTHQIRVHMASIGHPIVGDPLYGFKKQKFFLKGQALHAKKLSFIHPTLGTSMEFEISLPEYFCALLEHLRKIQK